MSDTILELRRDQWEQEHLGMCGTCKFVIRKKHIDYCDNPESERSGEEITYNDGCKKYWRL